MDAAAPILPREGAWSSVRSHWYFPSPRFVAGSALVVGLVTVPVVVVWHHLWPLVLLWPMLLALVLLGRGTELRLSAQGVEVLGDQFPWEVLELVDARWGTALRTSPRYRVKHRTIYLWMYAHDWRTGAIGDDLRAWAPELFEAEDEVDLDDEIDDESSAVSR